jgi:uncharacterized protein (DUF924 family)
LAQDYVAERLADEARQAVDEHVSQCAVCLDRVRSLFQLRDQFDEVWAGWSAAEHRRLHQQWQLAEALAEARSAAPSIFRRVHQQLAQWLESAAAGLSLAVLLDQTRRVACLAAAQLPAACRFTLHPAREGVGAGEELARLEELRQQGSALLAQHRSQDALARLVSAQGIDVRAVQGAISELSHEGTPLFQVVADGACGRVSVRHRLTQEGVLPAFALLVPLGPGEHARVAGFEPGEGPTQWIAEFRDVADGTYQLWFGPLAVP